jgi:putative (di)nucleoside polyphosphate hydrolase
MIMSSSKHPADHPTQLGYRPCVGLMLINRAGLVWIGCRLDAKGDAEGRGNWWQMPQGGIDDGEAPAEAALRELYEETGVRSAEIIAEHPQWLHYDLPAHLIGKAWGGRFRGQKQKWFALRFTGQDGEVQITPQDPAHQVEFADWKWARPDELLDLIVPFKREVYAQVLDELGHFAVPRTA